jgi:hypothetical protein
MVAACGIWCFGFQVVGMVWSWGLCVRFAGCSPQTDNLKTKAPNTTGGNNLYNTFELLMLRIMVPETCWASNKICHKNHLLHLVGILFPHINDDARSKSFQTTLRVPNSCVLFSFPNPPIISPQHIKKTVERWAPFWHICSPNFRACFYWYEVFIKQTCARNILHYDFNIYRTRKAGIDCGRRPALLWPVGSFT